jgi:hypothetical protein
MDTSQKGPVMGWLDVDSVTLTFGDGNPKCDAPTFLLDGVLTILQDYSQPDEARRRRGQLHVHVRLDQLAERPPELVLQPDHAVRTLDDRLLATSEDLVAGRTRRMALCPSFLRETMWSCTGRRPPTTAGSASPSTAARRRR